MKTILLLLITSILIACQIEQVNPKCTIGYLEPGEANNVLFIRTTDADTIHFSYINENGQSIGGMWIDGIMIWECIGFSLWEQSFELTLTAGDQTCVLIVPSINQ